MPEKGHWGQTPDSSHLGAVALLVPDYDEAIAFFVEVCDFELTEDRDEGRKRWVTVRPRGGETQIVLARADSDEQRAASASSCTPTTSPATTPA